MAEDIFVLGDHDTILGFKLIGVQGKIIDSEEEAREELERELDEGNVRLLLITREWSAGMNERIGRLKMTSVRPIVMEIPGRKAEKEQVPVSDLVKKAIGMNL